MAEPDTASTRLIEVGWLVVGELTAAQNEAVQAAREAVRKRLVAAFPRFDWRMPLVTRPVPSVSRVDEPVIRLDEGVRERDRRAWDFAFVVTASDLVGYESSVVLAVPSRALSVAVLSLARLTDTEEGDPSELARRMAALVLHLFGDLNGLWHREDEGAVMSPPSDVRELDGDREFDPGEIELLDRALTDVADLRLEESRRPLRPLRFYLRAGFERRGEIASAVSQARPWEFPLRLGRLTAAALSALALLLMTAEVWDLATRQSIFSIAILSTAVVAGSTVFILSRQKLLMRRLAGGLTEQIVVTNLAATLIVVLGLLTTYGALFALTTSLGFTLFDSSLIARWAPAVPHPNQARAVLSMAGFVSSLGLLIGSLGASFEGQHHFRHVIYADEET